jgi:drug/metabolite transporter (DMT)-like permease
MTASALLILSALFHALWNFALKHSNQKLGTALAFMIVATILNAIFAAATTQLPPISVQLLLGTIAAGLFEGFYFYLLNTAYATQTLGVAYTIMRGGAMVLVWMVSAIVMQEALSLGELLCVMGILIGIAMVQRSFRARDLLVSGVYAAYVCAGCIAGYHIAYGVAVRTGAAPAAVFAAAMACGVCTYIACSKGTALSRLTIALRHERALIAFGGTMCGLSFLLFLTALTVVEPGRAISLRNTSVAFGALLSLVSGERLMSIQWLGVMCVVAGVLGLL